jgi:sigma54-dependent transcription regulator
VIVRAVDALSDEEQRQVLDLLNDSGNGFPPRQVVTTCARPLFPLVHQGLFREDLYYRLNVVHLKIGEAPR